MMVIHRKLFLKVSSDDAAVPEAINVLAIWCWVWVSYFLLLDLIILLYVDFCFLYLLFITSSKKLLQWNQFWNILWKHDVVSRSYVACIIMASCIIHIFKVVSVSSYDGILIFWHVPVLHIILYVEIDSCGKLFVACN